MNKRIRIKDIAEKAGVSRGTVDRVLHNRGKVAPKVKEKILKVIEELGFEPNYFASALASKRSLRIVALMPKSSNELYWDASVKGIKGTTHLATMYGVEVKIEFFDLLQANSFLDKTNEILNDPPHGILFPPVFLQEGKEFLRTCKEYKIPVVIINTEIESTNFLTYIGQDSFHSGMLAARLLDFGLNTGDSVLIANLTKTPANAQHLASKEEGFRHYLAKETDKHLTILSASFKNYNRKQELKKWLQEIMEEHPKLSGIFFTNSRAHLAIDCLNPEIATSLKIVGFDLISPNINYLQEGKINFLINQNPEKQGHKGIMVLLDYLIKKKQPLHRKQFLPLDIVVKENWQYYV